MIQFRFGRATFARRVTSVDDQDFSERWDTQPPGTRLRGPAGSMFVAHYKDGDLTQNPSGLRCAALFIGLDGGLLFRVRIVPDDGHARARLKPLIEALLQLEESQRAAWAASRLLKMSIEFPYMPIGLECLPLEAMLDDMALRTRIANLLQFYSNERREQAEMDFIRCSFLAWVNETCGVTGQKPGRVSQLLNATQWGPEELTELLVDRRPIPEAVRLLPNGADALLDVVAEGTTPRPATTPAEPRRRRRLTSLAFFEEDDDDQLGS